MILNAKFDTKFAHAEIWSLYMNEGFAAELTVPLMWVVNSFWGVVNSKVNIFETFFALKSG